MTGIIEERGYWGPDADGDWVVNILGVGFAFAVADEEKAQEIVGRIRSERQSLTDRIDVLEGALRRVEPYLDAIVCYASSMDEHEPNRIAFDVRASLTQGGKNV